MSRSLSKFNCCSDCQLVCHLIHPFCRPWSEQKRFCIDCPKTLPLAIWKGVDWSGDGPSLPKCGCCTEWFDLMRHKLIIWQSYKCSHIMMDYYLPTNHLANMMMALVLPLLLPASQMTSVGVCQAICLSNWVPGESQPHFCSLSIPESWSNVSWSENPALAKSNDHHLSFIPCSVICC